MAIEKWEPPKTVCKLRAFLGFTNYYSSFIKNYAEILAPLMEHLRVGREEGTKGSQKRIKWGVEQQKIKTILCGKLTLQRVNPDKPFVLRTDASGYAVGASLEQVIDEIRMPTAADVRANEIVAGSFMSRKLTEGARRWVAREQETYVIVLALQKWESSNGMQPVLILTDHQVLEHGAK